MSLRIEDVQNLFDSLLKDAENDSFKLLQLYDILKNQTKQEHINIQPPDKIRNGKDKQKSQSEEKDTIVLPKKSSTSRIRRCTGCHEIGHYVKTCSKSRAAGKKQKLDHQEIKELTGNVAEATIVVNVRT